MDSKLNPGYHISYPLGRSYGQDDYACNCFIPRINKCHPLPKSNIITLEKSGVDSEAYSGGGANGVATPSPRFLGADFQREILKRGWKGKKMKEKGKRGGKAKICISPFHNLDISNNNNNNFSKDYFLPPNLILHPGVDCRKKDHYCKKWPCLESITPIQPQN